MLRKIAVSSQLRTLLAGSCVRRSAAGVLTCARWNSSRQPPSKTGRGPPGMPSSEDFEPMSQGAEGEEEERQPMPKPTEPPKFFEYDVNDAGLLTMRLNRKPVNSFSFEFFDEFNRWLAWMGDDEAIKAIVITSAIPTVFSAGLDISEMYKAKEERFAMFWSSLQHAFVTLHTFPKPLIAAVNGNAPAWGCLLALGCDYRIMASHPKGNETRPYRIGLNETKIGLVVPPWAMASMSYVVGRRQAERMMQLGETPTAHEALSIGLVDEVVSEDELLSRAEVAAKKFLSVNPQARWMTRDLMRGEIMYHLVEKENQEHDIQFFGNMIMSPEVQKSLGTYLDRLKGK